MWNKGLDMLNIYYFHNFDKVLLKNNLIHTLYLLKSIRKYMKGNLFLKSRLSKGLYNLHIDKLI